MKHPKPAIREPAPKYEAAGLLFAEFLNAIREEAPHVPNRLVAAEDLIVEEAGCGSVYLP